MAYRFMKNETLPHAFQRVFTEEIDWAVGQLANSRKRAEAVHEARKSMKKIRGLLSLVAGQLGSRHKVDDRYFRNAGRRLSELRDRQVMLEVFDELSAKHGEMDAETRLGIKRNLARNKGTLRDEKRVSAQVVRLLQESRPKVSQWPLTELCFDALLPNLVAGYRRGRRALKRAQHTGSAEAFHEFRKKVKERWYHMKLLEGVWDAETKGRAAEAKDLETCLGNEHNLTVLRERIAADVETQHDRQGTRRFLELLDDEAQILRKKALETGHKLYAEKPRESGEKLAKLLADLRIARKQPALALPKAESAVA